MYQLFKFRDCLTKNSIDKLSIITLFQLNHLPDNLVETLNRMIQVNSIPINLILLEGNLGELRERLRNFNKEINGIDNSKFDRDVIAMNNFISIKLIVNNNDIYVNFLTFDIDKNTNYIAAILHAIHIFCNLFPHDYSNLLIDICLDDNSRVVNHYYSDFSKEIKRLKQESAGFNVSGVTNRLKRKIILTKSEEIIKLLFHELIHFAELDSLLINTEPFLLSEAYTEFLSIILNSAYNSIHLSWKYNINVYEIYLELINCEINYSIYLSGNLFKFLRYSKDNLILLSKNKKHHQKTPIAAWEYIIIRTQLFLNLEKICQVLNNWKIESNNVNKIISLMKIDNNFQSKLMESMQNENISNHIGYIIIDLNWNNF
jgi:hypothetical protein